MIMAMKIFVPLRKFSLFRTFLLNEILTTRLWDELSRSDFKSVKSLSAWL